MYYTKFRHNRKGKRNYHVRKKTRIHGSDLEKVEAYYGIKKEDIIPFAGNVNPLGISPLLKKSMASHIESISEYPDRDIKSFVPPLHFTAMSQWNISLLEMVQLR